MEDREVEDRLDQVLEINTYEPHPEHYTVDDLIRNFGTQPILQALIRRLEGNPDPAINRLHGALQRALTQYQQYDPYET